MRQPAVSQRLARLRENGLVNPCRKGKNVYYSLSRPDVQQIVETLERVFCHR
jgi:DNA-binding transcriptional ArsR family regulator